MPPETRMTVQHREVEVGEVRLHVAIQGEGPPVLLLHGFPEFWITWRELMQSLADAGYCAIAPDMRGYNLSDKPKGIESYSWTHLVRDMRGLILALGHTRVQLIGHDWGGMVAWSLASRHPELVERLVIMNAGHPRLLARKLRKPDQMKKSWYVFFFQLPVLPELYVKRRAFTVGWLRDWAMDPASFPDELIDEYHAALLRPRAARSTINYYRASFRNDAIASRVPTKTLVIWGDRDKALDVGLLDGLERYVPDLEVVHLPDAGHWVMADQPDEVKRLVLDFIPAPNVASQPSSTETGS